MANSNKDTFPSVVFVAPSAYPLGGVAVWLHYLLHGLADQGFKIHLGLLAGNFHRSQEYLAHYAMNGEKVNVVEIESGSGTREGRVRAIAETIDSVKADIVVSVNAPDVFEAANRVKRYSKRALKTVMTLHGLEPDYFLDIKTYRAQIDAVLVTNLLTRQMVTAWADFSPERVLYAPYGVEMPSEKKTIKTQTPLTLLYAGRIEQEQKRIHDLLSVIAELEKQDFPYHLLLAGAGTQTESIIKALGEISNSGQITYLGNLSQSELIEQGYSVADVLLLLSDWETGPIVIWEAMAHGVAIASSQYSGSIAEQALVHNENALLFPVGDTELAANTIMQLSNETLRKKLVDKAYQLVADRYSREQSIAQWAQALTQVQVDITAKPATACREGWQKRGRIEQVLGHAIGHKLRTLIAKPALQNDAGDEWPHSLSYASDAVTENFLKSLHEVELK